MNELLERIKKENPEGWKEGIKKAEKENLLKEDFLKRLSGQISCHIREDGYFEVRLQGIGYDSRAGEHHAIARAPVAAPQEIISSLIQFIKTGNLK